MTNKNDKHGCPASFCAFTPGLDIVASHVKNLTKEDAKSNLLDSTKKALEEMFKEPD